MVQVATAPLTGKALLQKIKEISHLARREQAKQCGYFTVNKKNETRVTLTEFYDALLVATGIELDPPDSKEARGRGRNFRVSVHKNGQIVIGAAYTEAMGLKPGDEFVIKLGYKHIHLVQVEKTD